MFWNNTNYCTRCGDFNQTLLNHWEVWSNTLRDDPKKIGMVCYNHISQLFLHVNISLGTFAVCVGGTAMGTCGVGIDCPQGRMRNVNTHLRQGGTGGVGGWETDGMDRWDGVKETESEWD